MFSLTAEGPSTSVRGELIQSPDGKPTLKTRDGRLISLAGDADTTGVLKDKRLAGADFEVVGRFTAPDAFTVDPIHLRALFVHKNGKKLMITYWCEKCSIRTYTPGICWCCQEDTELDPREPDTQ